MKIGNEKKVKSADTNEFTETKKFKVLHCGNIDGNSNKFYCLELQYNPKIKCYRLFSHYGRLGLTEVFGVRDVDDTGLMITDYDFIEKQFNSIIKKKLSGKNIKDGRGLEESRHEQYVEVDTVAPTVGSKNIKGKTIQTKTVKGVDTSNIANRKIVRIIDQVVDENVHNIQSLTSLKLTVNGFETPLGPVTKQHVGKARVALDKLNSLLVNDKLDANLQDVRSSNNLYYSLIPHQFGRKITESDWILDATKLIEEFDLLDQLESAVTMGAAINQSASKRLDSIGIEIEELTDDKEIKRINLFVETSKKHHNMDVSRYKLQNIFKICISNERKRFEKEGYKLGNIKELFHGSKNCNILSIMKNGLIIPPVSASHVTGRLFGNGLYFANSSTKSLNYSTGWWTGSGNKYNNCFLFMGNVAMGKMYIIGSNYSGNPPKGYDSLYAKSGQGFLQNDEFIVYNLNQASLTYLIEMKK